MNALECRTLHRYMHAWPSCVCIAWLPVYGVTTYPAPQQGSGTVLFRVRAWSRSRGNMSLYKLKAYVIYLHWIMHFRATACHYIDQLKHRMAINHVAEVGAMQTQTGNSCTLLCHWAGLNMTTSTIPLCWVYLECVLSLRWPLPFNIGGLGQMDKNRQTIADCQ